jgi:hypothetical protein
MRCAQEAGVDFFGSLLDRSLLPLAVALPRMLAKIEAELAVERLKAAEEGRAELIRGLLAPSPIT